MRYPGYSESYGPNAERKTLGALTDEIEENGYITTHLEYGTFLRCFFIVAILLILIF